MSRIPRYSRRYLLNAERLGVVPGSIRGRAVGQAIAALARADALPAFEDVRAAIPPTRTAFVRRVPGRNLWLWYQVAGDLVTVVALTPDPPVPLDDVDR